MSEVESHKGLKGRQMAVLGLIALLSSTVIFLLDLGGLFQPLQLKAYDGLFYLRAGLVSGQARPSSPVVLVEIDDQTLAGQSFRIPRILWHHYFSAVIRGLADGGARVVGLDFLLPQAVFDDLVPDYSRTWLRALVYAQDHGTPIVTGIVRTAKKRIIPESRYMQIIGSERIGLFNLTTDSDDFIRRQRLFYPSAQDPKRGLYSVTFLLARAYRPDLKLPAEMIYIDYDPAEAAFPRFSFAEVYQRAGQSDQAYFIRNFEGRIVLIGEADSLTQDRHPTPLYHLSRGSLKRMAGVEILGHTVKTILKGRFFIDTPAWLRPAVYFVLALMVCFVTIHGPQRLVLVLWPALLLTWLGAGAAAFSSYFILPVVGGTAVLLVSLAASFAYRFRIAEKERRAAEVESAEVNRMLGLSFQNQGLLDLAFDYLKRVPMSDGLEEVLYNLALDYERKRQLKKAVSVYEYIKRHSPGFRDVGDKIKKLNLAAGSMIFGLGTRGVQAVDGSLFLDENTRPTLGRYEIYKELGRGGMGVVYLGRDPKIGRATAIKAIRFSEEYEPDEAERLKAQFFGEAETAGRLSHPNIVTIYDAGDDNDLSYIAMEYLDGYDLREHTAPDNLLPGRQVIGIAADIAEALDYAHEQGVVHRDVKPANIMLQTNGAAKITDFGIARAMASSKTRTGLIKGTPFYMSPEQILGRPVDGRSDIFSLGVVLYELLSGITPFRTDDLTVLIYKITAERPEPITLHNPKVPKVLSKIIEKALAKDLERRYQKAGQMAEHLRIVARKIDERRAQRKAGQAGSFSYKK